MSDHSKIPNNVHVEFSKAAEKQVRYTKISHTKTI